MSTTECQHCGATIKSQGARFCEFCGTELVREGAPRTQTRDEARKTRFELLLEHPDLQRWMAHTPEMPPLISHSTVFVAFPLLAIFAIGIFMFMKIGSSQTSGGIRFAPIFVLAFIAAALFGKLSSTMKVRSAPFDRRPAIVAGERAKVSGGGENSRATTKYFVTLEFADGQRRELRVDGRIAGDLSDGDAGVAYIKHDALISFRRLAV